VIADATVLLARPACASGGPNGIRASMITLIEGEGLLNDATS
jgi:hypothetical protein